MYPHFVKYHVHEALVETVACSRWYSVQLVNYPYFGAVLGMNHVTTQKYVGVLENLFNVRALQPWYTNTLTLKRLTKSPKLHFLDFGLLATLNDISLDRLNRE